MHEEINIAMQQWIADRSDCRVISPTALAIAVLQRFEPGRLEPHIEYTSLEHFKQMARRVLAHRFGEEGDDNPAYEDQGQLFSGHLQDRYPIPRKRNAEPQYKLRFLLTERERAWNVEQLRKSASARLAHADALEAEGLAA
ncbi:hypothetical protein [Sinorhizobium meliloti]|nr:hypothetical protein [Sinorhizobium meliloti]MQV80727.1 hypothetical protein [Sinorhizobium meliloti]